MAATTTSTSLVPVQPVLSDAERLALTGFLAGCGSLTREAYTLDLRQHAVEEELLEHSPRRARQALPTGPRVACHCIATVSDREPPIGKSCRTLPSPSSR